MFRLMYLYFTVKDLVNSFLHKKEINELLGPDWF